MPIKPMDMQVLLPNIKKAARAENVKNSKQELAQQQGQIKNKMLVETKKNKVANLEKKDTNVIKDNKNRNTDLGNRKKNKRKKEEEEEEEKVKTDHGNRFDMKV